MPLPVNYNYYHFTPSQTLGLVATCLFGASVLVHTLQIWRTKAYFFGIFTLGGLIMTGGYICRVLSSNDPTSFIPFVVQAICTVIPPAFYAATIYMTYGRMVRYIDADALSIIAPQKVTKIFLIGDIIALCGQSTGGGLTPHGDTMAKVGNAITIVGLGVQLIFFGFFLVVISTFERRVRSRACSRVFPRWLALLYVLVFVSALIIIRCIFRIVEFVQGTEGYLATHEAWLYGFDALPMFLVQAVFHIWHPGNILEERKREKFQPVIDLNNV